MRIFITGATGVIGRRVIPLLVSAGHSVTAMLHSAEKRHELLGMGAAVAQVDLFELASLRSALDGHDVAINLATHMPSSSTRMLLRSAWHENDQIRSQGSANLARAAQLSGTGRIIQESFAPVYPDQGDRWIDEVVPIEPAAYNRSVADAERSAARFGDSGGTAVVLRFAAFYGPDAWHMREFMRMVRRGFAPLLGRADSFISSLHHDDAASAVLAALLLPPGVYNVADDEPVSHREYVDSLAAAMNVRAPKLAPAWAAALAGSVGKTVARSLRVSNRKLRNAAGWRPIFPSVREGWPAMIAGMSDAPASRARAA